MRKGRTPSKWEKEKILNAVFAPLEVGPAEEGVASPQIGSTDWLSGIGVLGWKRVMSRELFESEAAARQWVESHGLKDVEYIPASMPKMPDNAKLTDAGVEP